MCNLKNFVPNQWLAIINCCIQFDFYFVSLASSTDESTDKCFKPPSQVQRMLSSYPKDGEVRKCGWSNDQLRICLVNIPNGELPCMCELNFLPNQQLLYSVRFVSSHWRYFNINFIQSLRTIYNAWSSGALFHQCFSSVALSWLWPSQDLYQAVIILLLHRLKGYYKNHLFLVFLSTAHLEGSMTWP